MTGARRAVFLDRDGTLIREREYLADPEGVELVEGAVGALSTLRGLGLAVVVVTNQSGIARGLYTEEDYRAVAARLDAELRTGGVAVEGTYYCPHHPEASGPCECRKPATGLYLRAARELDLSTRGSWFVGDKLSDVRAARELGGRGVLVRTGYGREAEGALRAATSDSPDRPSPLASVHVADDLAAAARWIAERERGARGNGSPS